MAGCRTTPGKRAAIRDGLCDGVCRCRGRVALAAPCLPFAKRTCLAPAEKASGPELTPIPRRSFLPVDEDNLPDVVTDPNEKFYKVRRFVPRIS